MTCCVTGRRPERFPFPCDQNDPTYKHYRGRLREEVLSLYLEGYRTFLCGMAEGADLDFAEEVLTIQAACNDVILEAALPYPPFERKYPGRRERILSLCNRVHTVSDYYYAGCMQKRNIFMVDRSITVLAIWDGVPSGGTFNTISYAKEVGRSIRYLMLNELPN